MKKRVMGKARIVKVARKKRHQFEVLGGGAAAASALLVISIFLVSSMDSVLVRSQQYASVFAAVLTDLANTDRTQNALGKLAINEKLVQAAQMKANDMAAHSYFSHTSPTGVDPWHWFKEAGYNYKYAGENLAIDFSDSEDVNAGWMNSPTHRANILDQHFTEVGIATAEGFYQGRPTTFVVQEFGAPPASSAKTTAGTKTAVIQKVPQNPTQPATVIAGAPARVLGEADSNPTEPAPITATAPAESASVSPVTKNYASPILHAVAAPRSTLFNLYSFFGALLIIGLAFVTGFEVHVRHLRKAIAAGGLFALMLALFIIANLYVFPEPILPDSNQVASAVNGSTR